MHATRQQIAPGRINPREYYLNRTEAYGVLGLSPAASLQPKEIKARRDKLALQHHPDHGGSLETMKAINAAYDIVLVHVTFMAGLKADFDDDDDVDVDFDVDADDDREPDDDDDDDDVDAGGGGDGADNDGGGGLPAGFPNPQMDFICILEAVAGAGKTRELTRQLSRSLDARAVFAAPTIDLITEIEGWLKQHDCKVPVTVVHSRGFATRAVRERIAKWFEAHAKDDNPPGVLVATHAALLDLPPPMYADRYHLVFDEVPDVTAFSLRQLPRRSRWFTWLLNTQDYRPGVLRIVPGSKRGDELDRLLTIARNHPHDEGDALFQDWAAAVLDPDRYVLVAANRWHDLTLPYSARQFGGEIDMLTVLHLSRFRWWKTFTIAGAQASRSMTHLLWRHLFHARFIEHPLQRTLPREHTNGHRLTLRYFFQERATRSGLALGATSGESMQMAMCRSTAEYFGKREFLWTLPQPTEGGGVKTEFWNRGRGPAFLPKLRLSGKSMGQNQYREHTRLALLSVILFTPGQYELLLALGLTQEWVLHADAGFGARQSPRARGGWAGGVRGALLGICIGLGSPLPWLYR